MQRNIPWIKHHLIDHFQSCYGVLFVNRVVFNTWKYLFCAYVLRFISIFISGAAASNFQGGVTTHSALKLNTKLSRLKFDADFALTQIFVVDEVSFMNGSKGLKNLDQHMRILTGNRDEIFQNSNAAVRSLCWPSRWVFLHHHDAYFLSLHGQLWQRPNMARWFSNW